MLLVALAHASDTWTEPYEGVRYLHRTTSDPMEIFVAEIDLCGRGIALRATDSDEIEQTVSSFGNNRGAQVAINGDFFSYDTYYPSGIGLGAGNLWNDDPSNEGFYVFGGETAWFSAPSETWSALDAGMENAVGGRPQLVEDGELTYDYSDPSHCADLNPRTAMGMSRDGQTLWLAVVDGRSSDSEGMTCEQLAELMQELGAWTALNLDGGGSSTLWFDSLGVVNEPSDGSERVVSNHLAVIAEETGAPDSCDMCEAELVWDASIVDDGPTDVDGDGLNDICARAAAGWRCYPSTGTGFGDPYTTDKFANDNGWDDVSNYASIRLPDLDGDGKADICGRGDGHLYCALSTGSGWGETLEGPALSDADGYEDLGATATVRFGDVDADGDLDVCARGPDGMSCWPWTGAGFGDAIAGPTLSDGSGWGATKYNATIRMGDVDGDERADLCARAAAGMRCWLSDGASVTTQIEGPAWSDAAGWDTVDKWSTIRLVDLDGDGRADLCGRGADGVECARSNGAGFDPVFAGPSLTDASGWSDHDNYSTLRFADVDADGDLDACARANARVYCWLQAGDDFSTRIDGPELSDDAGWDDPRYYTTIRLGDLDGDHDADLCARGPDGVTCWLADALAFATEVAGPTWSDSSGWDGRQYLSTIRFGGVTRAAAPGDSGDSGDPGDSGGTADSAGTTDSADGETPGAKVESADEGCGCATGAAAPWSGLIAGFALATRRSARRRGGTRCRG